MPALVEAGKQLQGVKTRWKHVLLVSSSAPPAGGVAKKASDLRGLAITISAVGVWGAERELLAKIVDAGDGRLYMAADFAAMPKIGIKEVREVTGR